MGKYYFEVSSFDRGGLEKVVLDLGRLMKESGDQVSVVTTGSLGLLADLAKSEGVGVIQLRKPFAGIRYFLLLLRNRPNAVVSHFTYFGYIAAFLARVPNITYIHNVYAFFSPKQLRDFRRADRFVRGYIAVSSMAADYAASNLGVSPSKILVVPNGYKNSAVPARELQTISRSALGLAETDFVFICPANLNLHKGFFLLLEALGIARVMEPRIKVISLGGPVYAPHAELLKETIKQANLEDAFLILGHTSDIESFYKLADAAILTSFIEGWSIAVNEALAASLPVILSDTGSARDLIENSDCGILISQPFGEVSNLNPTLLNELSYTPQPYSTSPEVAGAMVKLSGDRALAASMGAAGRAKILKHYNEKIWLDNTCDALERLSSAK